MQRHFGNLFIFVLLLFPAPANALKASKNPSYAVRVDDCVTGILKAFNISDDAQNDGTLAKFYQLNPKVKKRNGKIFPGEVVTLPSRKIKKSTRYYYDKTAQIFRGAKLYFDPFCVLPDSEKKVVLETPPTPSVTQPPEEVEVVIAPPPIPIPVPSPVRNRNVKKPTLGHRYFLPGLKIGEANGILTSTLTANASRGSGLITSENIYLFPMLSVEYSKTYPFSEQSTLNLIKPFFQGTLGKMWPANGVALNWLWDASMGAEVYHRKFRFGAPFLILDLATLGHDIVAVELAQDFFSQPENTKGTLSSYRADLGFGIADDWVRFTFKAGYPIASKLVINSQSLSATGGYDLIAQCDLIGPGLGVKNWEALFKYHYSSRNYSDYFLSSKVNIFSLGLGYRF